MAHLHPRELTTRQEKILGVTVALVSVAAHIMLLVGSFSGLLPKKVEKRERLMVVRRVPPAVPEVPVDAPGPAARRVNEGAVTEKGTPPPPPGGKREPEKPREDQVPPEEPPPEPPDKARDNTISIFTDLKEAFFRLEGPYGARGGGTFWEKSKLPAGDYTVTFGTVPGYGTPKPASGTLRQGGSLSFVGRYTKMTQVTVNVNVEVCSFKIVMPDGRSLEMGGSCQGFFKDLPAGVYTVVFNEVPGFATPSPQSRSLRPGGHLSFSGSYAAEGKGYQAGIARQEQRPRRPEPKREEPLLDRRVKMVVKSYPETEIESRYGIVSYPEVAIRKGNYQAGWCQVYLVLTVDDRGRIGDIKVERPSEDEWELFKPLIETVKDAVQGWDFPSAAAEVHVDVRFYVEK